MDKIAVSACLLGANTKYNGSNNLRSELFNLFVNKTVFVCCPETISGLSIPRDPSERVDEKVISSTGNDVTSFFELGALKTLDFLKRNDVKLCLFKEGSPSCGLTEIYDGSFSRKKIAGVGKTSELLKLNGIDIISIK